MEYMDEESGFIRLGLFFPTAVNQCWAGINF
jgi:hypothetical protein